METKVCMNSMCGITSTLAWKKGWGLRSGGFADLCYDCGCAYENYIFCETFHSGETGWRECTACKKLLHCGCVASKFFIDLMDYGGVKCIDCRKDYGFSSPSVQIQKTAIPIDFRPTEKDNCGIWFTSDPQKTVSETGKNLQSEKIKGGHQKQSPLSLQIKQEEDAHFSQKHIDKYPKMLASNTIFSHANVQEVIAVDMTSTQPSSATTTSTGSPDWVLSVPFGKGIEANEVIPLSTQGNIAYDTSNRQKTGISQVSELNTGVGFPTRVGRPSTEGRTRNQLLHRYWPRITDHELKQISGNLNSRIIPLFEKVLSASDASRIGRLVLPKACAEAYFPPISKSEGVPLKIVDMKGTEWTFQFRFWPNNNSRMYVLEGVTPCIQSMQLQAGDTVTFSMVDPGGKFLMGFRKAENPIEAQIVQDFGFKAKCRGFCDEMEDIPSKNKLLQTWRGSPMTVENGECVGEKVKSEKNRSRNIGPKTKRLLMPSEDVWELRITWEEAQDMLLPPPSVKPTVVMIENHRFEEYDEPPVFGRTSTHAVGELEQWAHCDISSEWPKVPTGVPPHGCTCHRRPCDSDRASGLEPEEKKAAEPEEKSSCETDQDEKAEYRFIKPMTVEGCFQEGVGRIDLNYDPKWDECRGSMMRLVRKAGLPLEEYMRENGLESLVQGPYSVSPCGDSCDDIG